MAYRFLLKSTSMLDKPLYQACLNHQEFRFNLFNTNQFTIERLVTPDSVHLKYVLLVEKSKTLKPLGFAHFYRQSGEAVSFNMIGGILPQYFNSGVGVHVTVFLLHHMLKSREEAQVVTGVYKYNLRSLRMLKAIGFYEIEEKECKFILTISKDQFDNRFVSRILDRMFTVKGRNRFLN